MLHKMVAGLLLAWALPTMASATQYSFSFAGFGSGHSGSGTITTSDTKSPKLGYDITAINGTFDGHTPLTLIATDPNKIPTSFSNGSFDNIFFPGSATVFDQYGIAFTDGSLIYNIFGAIADYENNLGPDGKPVGPRPPKPYGLIAGVDGAGQFAELTYGDFTLTGSGAVPEASSWALLVVGFGVMGGSLRQSRKARLISA